MAERDTAGPPFDDAIRTLLAADRRNPPCGDIRCFPETGNSRMYDGLASLAVDAEWLGPAMGPSHLPPGGGRAGEAFDVLPRQFRLDRAKPGFSNCLSLKPCPIRTRNLSWERVLDWAFGSRFQDLPAPLSRQPRSMTVSWSGRSTAPLAGCA